MVDPAIFARFGLNSQLHNGRLTIYLDPVPGAVQVGDEIVLKIGLQDASMPQPVEDSITVRITEEADSRPRKNITKRDKLAAGDKGEKEGTGKPAPTHGLPPHRLMTEDGRKVGTQESIAWPEGFNEYDGGSIDDLGEQGILYNINYDNAYHIKYRRAARGGDIGRDVVTRTGAGEFPPGRSVHAAGRPFSTPVATAPSAHRRSADQNAIRCAAEQKRWAEPPRRAANGLSHHRQVQVRAFGAASFGKASGVGAGDFWGQARELQLVIGLPSQGEPAMSPQSAGGGAKARPRAGGHEIAFASLAATGRRDRHR